MKELIAQMRVTLLCCLILSMSTSISYGGEKQGLTKTESPVPFGKLTYVTGYGFKKDDINLKFVRINDEETIYPDENISFHSLLKERAVNLPAVQQYENILTVKLPEMKNGLALLFLENEKDINHAVVVNRPELQWLSTNRAETGDTLRAIGKGLVNIGLYPERDSNGLPVSYADYIPSDTRVVIKDATGNFFDCKIVKTSAYDVHFIIPDGVKAGEGKLFVHAGIGGQYGWSEYQLVNIKNEKEWSSEIFNVRDYGAVGDGFADDTKPVQDAIDDIRKNKGGILFFPAGGYHLNAMFRVPENTIIRGESRERTWIYLPDGFHTNAMDSTVKVVFAGEGSIGMENLSVHAVYVNYILMAPVGNTIPENWIEFSWEEHNTIPGADHSFVRNCRLLHNPTHLYHRREDNPRKGYFIRDQSVNVLLRGNYIEITDSEFQGKESNVYLCDSKYSIISDNIMHSGNTGNNIGLQHGKIGYEKIIVENNVLDGIAPTHHGSVWMMHGGKNLFFYNNDVVRQFWVSDNEGLLGHMWGYRLPIFIKKTYDDRIEIDLQKWEQYWNKMEKENGNLSKYFPFNKQKVNVNDFSIYEGKEVQVFRGQGIGQVNTVDRVEGNILYFKDPFKTPLTKESFLVLHEAPAFRHIVFAKNRIEDTGQAIFLWGHSHEIVIDGNSAVRTGPIGGWTVFHAFSVAGGCHYFQIINNYCSEGRAFVPGQHRPGGRYVAGGIGAQYSCESNWASGGGALNYAGYIIRNNLLENDCSFSFPGYENTWCSSELDKSSEQKFTPFDFVGMVFEDNTNKDCNYGMYLGKGMKAVIKNNEFINVETEVIGAENEGIMFLK